MSFDKENPPNEPDMAIVFRQYWGLIWHWAWLILLAALLAGVTAFVVSKSMTPVYQAESKVLVMAASGKSTDNVYQSVLTSGMLARTYADMMITDTVLTQVIKRLNLGIPVDDLVKEITITPIRDTQLIKVVVEGANPIEIAQIANTIIAIFSEQIQTLETSRYSASKENLQTQIVQMEKQIEELNIRKATTILETSRYSASKVNLLAQKSRMERELNVLNDQLATDARGIEIASLEAQIGPNENEIASLSVQIATNENLIAGLETQIVQYRQINVTLLTNYEQTRLAEAQNVSNVVPVNTATPPLIPVRPKVLINTLLAALIAMIMAIGGILALDSLDDTIKTPEDVVNKLGIPIVGVIFRYEEQQPGLITQAQPRSPISEAFRALRTNVQYANVDTPLRMIMVTSASPREGKSIIAANLAVVLAQGGIRVTGIKVTLIDADLRRPTLHKWFTVDNQNGLTHLIVQPQINLNGILKETKTRGLTVLTAGDLPPNPSEMLGSNKMSNIIQEIKKIQDVIIVDTPPVLAVADAAVLAPAMDGVLFVIQPGVTTFSAARQAIEQLKRVGANLVGVVLNNVDLRGSRYAYYYRNSYYYQTKYYAADDHKTKA